MGGADAVATGCVSMSAATPAAQAPFDMPLFDVATAKYSCSQGSGNCMHTVGLWQVWVADASDDLVILGDLSAYVSLSGYRFRLPSTSSTPLSSSGSSAAVGNVLIAVGQPDEEVTVTYLRKVAGGQWIVHNQAVTIGSTGRTEFTLA